MRAAPDPASHHEHEEEATNKLSPENDAYLLGSELPLQVNSQQAKHLRGHFEAARHLYHALLGEAVKRLRHMRADVRWQQARLIPRSDKQARKAAFAALRKEFGFAEYALHAFATQANTSWIADHMDANTAQTLASRAYHAANRVCVGQARRVRFRSKGRGLSSLEGKTNAQGIRFVLQRPHEGNQGWLVWGKERISALIDWPDPVVLYGLLRRCRSKYVRLRRTQG